VIQSTVFTELLPLRRLPLLLGRHVTGRMMFTIVQSSMLVEVSTTYDRLPPMRRPVRYCRLPSPVNRPERVASGVGFLAEADISSHPRFVCRRTARSARSFAMAALRASESAFRGELRLRVVDLADQVSARQRLQRSPLLSCCAS